ncbi:hypothetical protein Tco_1269801 [Tanacetum coccineum]
MQSSIFISSINLFSSVNTKSNEFNFPQKSQGSNSGDSGNIRDGGKIVGRAIGACGSGIGDSLLVTLYACITFIYGSLWKGKMVSEAKRSLDRSSEGLEKVFPGEAGK